MELMTRKEALTLKLHERESVLHDRELSPVEPQYCIVWEDPTKLDDPVKVTVPSPEWLAMAMHGNILPPVDVCPLVSFLYGAPFHNALLSTITVPLFDFV